MCKSLELLELEFELPLLFLGGSEAKARNKNAPTIKIEPIVLKYFFFILFEFMVNYYLT